MTNREPPEHPHDSPFEQVRALPPTEKFRLALRADRTVRAILLRDTDPRTLFYLCQNPHLTLEDVLQIAKDPRILADTVGAIMRAPQWIGREEIRCALIRNPKTPLVSALRLLSALTPGALRALAKSQSVRRQIKHAALKLVVEGHP